MNANNRITRILLCKWALDAHDRGVKTLAKTLLDAGMEVIFTRFEFPEEIVNAAEEEAVDLIGISCSMGEHNRVAPEILKRLEQGNMKDISLIFGGVIPPKDSVELRKLGVNAVFGPGSSLKEITTYISEIKHN
jgi:methylmalonyl-CoA mutase C-terminal domain/subunit